MAGCDAHHLCNSHFVTDVTCTSSADLLSLLLGLLAPNAALFPCKSDNIVASLDELLGDVLANVACGTCYQYPHILFVSGPEILLCYRLTGKLASALLMCAAAEPCLE